MLKNTLLRASPALLGLLIVSAITIANAHDIVSAEFVTESQAKNLARSYLDSIGYSRAGTSVKTALVGGAELRQETWVVHVRVGGRLPSEDGVVLVDAKGGTIKAAVD
jgi:hypothetical protein